MWSQWQSCPSVEEGRSPPTTHPASESGVHASCPPAPQPRCPSARRAQRCVTRRVAPGTRAAQTSQVPSGARDGGIRSQLSPPARDAHGAMSPGPNPAGCRVLTALLVPGDACDRPHKAGRCPEALRASLLPPPGRLSTGPRHPSVPGPRAACGTPGRRRPAQDGVPGPGADRDMAGSVSVSFLMKLPG